MENEESEYVQRALPEDSTIISFHLRQKLYPLMLRSVLLKNTIGNNEEKTHHSSKNQPPKRHRGFFMGPSASSGYLCTAHYWKTERRRSEVCKEGAMQRYPDLARGDLKNSIFFLVEVDSGKPQ